MAIDNLSGGDARIEVTTSAVGESLGTQAEQTGNNTIILSDTFDTLAEADTEPTIDYIDRLVMIRRGTGTQEIRRIIADSAGTGNLRILTVHEDWLIVPASSDDCQVSYVIQDCATIGAQFTLLNKRNTDYTSSKRLQVGDGTNFGWLAFLDGVSYETLDNSSTTEADFTVNGTGNPRFTNGYVFGGNPVSGGYFIATPALAGELSWEVIDGGATDLYDFFFTGIISHEFAFRASTTGSVIRGNKMKLFVQARELELLCQNTQITDLTVEGSANTADIIRCREWDSNGFIQDFKLISTNGLATRDSDTSTETLEFRNTTFINNTQLIEINSNKTWNIVNPVWSPTTVDQSDFDFLTATGNVINERFSLDTTSLTVAGLPLTAKIYVVNADDGTGSELLAHELTADSNGLANADVIKREFTDDSGTAVLTATSATFAVISSEYGEIPIIVSYTPDNDDSTTGLFGNAITFNHLTDVFQVQGTPATSITDGDAGGAIAFEEQATNPASIIKYTGGSGTLTVGATVTGDNSTADGIVVEILEGDSVAGSVLLDTRDALAFTTAEGLTESGTSSDWTGTFTTGSETRYDWLLDGNSKSSQVIYDYMNAKLDEAILDVAGGNAMDDILFWANQGINALPVVGDSLGTPNKFLTVREVNKTAGWVVYNTSLGGWASFESNDGTLFIPASTVTVQITVVEAEDFVTAVVGARVGVHRVSDNSEILNDTTNGSGVASTSFTYTGDVPVFIRVRQETEAYVKIPATITSTGLITTISVADDDIYA